MISTKSSNVSLHAINYVANLWQIALATKLGYKKLQINTTQNYTELSIDNEIYYHIFDRRLEFTVVVFINRHLNIMNCAG